MDSWLNIYDISESSGNINDLGKGTQAIKEQQREAIASECDASDGAMKGGAWFEAGPPDLDVGLPYTQRDAFFIHPISYMIRIRDGISVFKQNCARGGLLAFNAKINHYERNAC